MTYTGAMNTYRMRVGKDLGASLHSLSCPVAAHPSRAYTVVSVHAASPLDAVKAWDIAEDVQTRGLPRTKVCKCCSIGTK